MVCKSILINVTDCFVGCFAVADCMVYFDEPPWVVLVLFPNRFSSYANRPFGTLYLPVTYRMEIIPVFQRIRNNKLLLKFYFFRFPIYCNIYFFLDPTALVINLIKIQFRI